MALHVGTRLGPYEILSLLGKGGMGEVYRARDTRLDRDVAVKVLPAELSEDEAYRKRLEREAKTISQLQHPHVCMLLDIGSEGETQYLVMEYLDGETLADRLKAGPLPIDQVLRIGEEIAQAVDAAHQQGIVHRDLKPANVMLTKSGTKVLDFGLAQRSTERLADPDAATETIAQALTVEGRIVGTMPYMAPEQLQGGQADPQIDIWALGCILYEMATGRRPFQGKSQVDLITAIMSSDPQPLAELSPEAPKQLDHVVRRCLDRQPERRWQSAQDVGIELEAIDAQGERAATFEEAGAQQQVPWIAVLPFRNRSADPTFQSLGEDLAEEIITGLSRFKLYHVVAAAAAYRVQGQSGEVQEVARELGARYVLAGSVRQAGDRLRVNVQLSDAVSGARLWAETYQRDSSSHDVFELQDELTDCIVATVADSYGVLARSMGALVRSKSVEDIGVYESVLQWFAYFERVTPTEHLRSRKALERAMHTEPDNAIVRACLASIYLDEYRFDFNRRDSPLERALDTAQRAVELDATCALAWTSLALTQFFRGDQPAFRVAFERTAKLNPRDASSLASLGILISQSGDWEEGLEITRRAMELNPHHPGWYYFSTFGNHYRKGEYAEAYAAVKQINLPGHVPYHAALAASAAQLGLIDEAQEAMRELLRVAPFYAEKPAEFYVRWNFEEDFIEHILDGLRKAGLEE